jgi:predicted nucleic acid-binding protein
MALVVRRYAAIREIELERGVAALADLADMLLCRYSHDRLLRRVWALRHDLIAYDAVYVALTEALDAPLLTRDQRMAAASGHHARIELV